MGCSPLSRFLHPPHSLPWRSRAHEQPGSAFPRPSAGLTLVLACTGVFAPAALAKKPPTHHIPAPIVAGINVDASTIPLLQELMNRHRLKSSQLTRFYLHRIKKLNPLLNAVITVSPTAKADAKAADKARKRGVRLPLLGIPVIVKDNVNTTGMPTTAGSWALAGSSPSDAFIVQRLRAAGAIVIAKANLSEWANFRSAPSSSGWSGIGGQTNMAYVLDRNPCGSSPARASACPRTSRPSASARRRTARSSAPRAPTASSASSHPRPLEPGRHRADLGRPGTAGPMTRNVTDAAVVLGAVTASTATTRPRSNRRATP